MQNHFRSLRVRLLLPLLAVALLASLAVAVGSYLLGDKWAQEDLLARYQGIEETLSRLTFPLTQPVIDSLASLTDTEMAAINDEGKIVAASWDGLRRAPVSMLETAGVPMAKVVSIDGHPFRYGVIIRTRLSNDGVKRVAVFFDASKLRAARLRAASLVLLTGLSTIILLTSVTLFVTNRLISRLSRLQLQVNKIASGDFETTVPIGPADEVGVLAGAVQRMNEQLKRMWTTLQRQQGQKLLHQLAGGLAHQLRNSITGARMAVELHRKHCGQPDDALQVAISQLEQTESHMQRLLIVASGRQQADQPQLLVGCLSEVERVLTATARHLRVALNWQMGHDLDNLWVADGPSLHAAVTNLVLNAVQAAEQVWVTVDGDDREVVISVVDNGKGPPDSVAGDIFEPFVTSKPEGLGLGLPLVAESAKRLGGKVTWKRDNQLTQFMLTVRVSRDSDDQANHVEP